LEDVPMKAFLFAAASAAVLAAAPALAQSTAKADKSFIDNVARDGQGEVAIAQLAEQKGSSPAVKQLAQRLVADHTKANQQLQQIAEQEGVTPPKGMSQEQSDTRAKLEKLNGAAFDRAFLQGQVQDHQKDVQYFQREANTLQDPKLKSFAQQTLPVLQQHLQMAQQAESQLSSSGSSNPTAGGATHR
jgi:putative membrane protein